MMGLMLLAIFYWGVGYWSHWINDPNELMPSNRFWKYLCMIPRKDEKMSFRGIAFQLSGYIFVIGALFSNQITDSDAKIWFNFLLFCALQVLQFIWVVLVAPRWVKR